MSTAQKNELDVYKTETDSKKKSGSYYQDVEELLRKNYASQTEALAKQRKKSLQEASISYDKLRKYLPMQMKAQGLGGLGVSESTLLDAYSDHSNNRSAIQSDYAAQESELLQKYNEDTLNLRKEQGDKAYEALMSDIENGRFNTTYQLESEYAAISPYLNEVQTASVERALNYYKNNSEFKNSDADWYKDQFYDTDGKLLGKAEATEKLKEYIAAKYTGGEAERYQKAYDELYADKVDTTGMGTATDKVEVVGGKHTFDAGEGDTFKININGGGEYKVDRGATATGNLAATLESNYIALKGAAGAGNVLVYNDRIYMRDHKGRWFTVVENPRNPEGMQVLCNSLGVKNYTTKDIYREQIYKISG